VLPDCKKEVSAAECALVLTPEELETLGKVGIALQGASGAARLAAVHAAADSDACSDLLMQTR
jgi:hypothetical protein